MEKPVRIAGGCQDKLELHELLVNCLMLSSIDRFPAASELCMKNPAALPHSITGLEKNKASRPFLSVRGEVFL